MKRNPRRLTLLLPAFILAQSLSSRAAEIGVEAPGGPLSPVAPLAPVSPASLGIESPALPAETAVSGLAAPAMAAETAMPPTLPSAALPFNSSEAQAARPREATAGDAAARLAAAGVAADGQEASPAAIQSAAGQVFDGSQAARPAGGGGSFDGGNFDSGNGGGSNGGGNNNNGDSGAPLDKMYPKVVVILDTFKGPASESTVQYIEKLADIGVHVVFVTPRPEKGENSAESVLTSKLRTRGGNPVMIVSYNGARISMHRATRAENPKGAVADSEGFAQPTLDLFSAVGEAAKARYRLGEVSEVKSGVEDNVYIYGSEFSLPKRLAKAKRGETIREIVKFYNGQVAEAGLNYRFEATEQPDGKVRLQAYSTALRLNMGRVFSAIGAQYPDVRDRLKPEDVLFFADSARSPKFMGALRPGHFIHGVTNEAELEQGLFALLHGKGLEDVKVTRNQLRSYISWLEARQRFGNPRGGGGFRLEPSVGRYQQEAKFYLAIIHYHLMAELYHRIRNHDFDHANLSAALQLAEDMVKNPKAFGINLDEDLEHMRGKKKFKPFERDRLGVIREWLIKYYERNFPDFPRGVSESVVGTMINLSRDSGTNIKLYYESPMTKRRYQVGVLPARGHVEKDDHGYMLVVHAYRTGKEMRQDDFEEALEVNLAMRAMLQGYAKKEADGRWTVNGEPARVMAIYHTMTRDMPSKIMSPEEVEARSAEVTALIEKMLADKEFLAYWAEEQAKNERAKVGQATHKAKQAAKTKTKKKA